MEKRLLIDLSGYIVGTTMTTTVDGLYKAVNRSTGESWGLVTIRPLDWPRRRVWLKDLQPLDLVPVDKSL